MNLQINKIGSFSKLLSLPLLTICSLTTHGFGFTLRSLEDREPEPNQESENCRQINEVGDIFCDED